MGFLDDELLRCVVVVPAAVTGLLIIVGVKAVEVPTISSESKMLRGIVVIILLELDFQKFCSTIAVLVLFGLFYYR